MSKYTPLWEYISEKNAPELKIAFEEIQSAAGVPIDHSFLKYKKELEEYGFRVKKISLKEQTVLLEKL